MSLYPLLLNPALHVKVWGGRRLETLLGKTLPTTGPYGESWEMHDTATVADGPHAGRSLADMLRQYGHDLVGPDDDPADGFPLLAKFLDPSD
jgi:mannose-6-phosphate isomerase